MNSEHFLKYLEHFAKYTHASKKKKKWGRFSIGNYISNNRKPETFEVRCLNSVVISDSAHTSHQPQLLGCCFYVPLIRQYPPE